MSVLVFCIGKHFWSRNLVFWILRKFSLSLFVWIFARILQKNNFTSIIHFKTSTKPFTTFQHFLELINLINKCKLNIGQEVACWLHCWYWTILFDRCNKSGAIDLKLDRSAIDVKMGGSALEEILYLITLGLSFSSKLDWGSYNVSIAKTTSNKIGALILSMKFLSPVVALYLYKFTIQPCMEYYCHIWGGAPSCYLVC